LDTLAVRYSLQNGVVLTLDPWRKLSLLTPEGTKLRWPESAEEDLKNMGFRNWRSKAQDREEWRAIVEEAKVHQELYCKKKKIKNKT
jgi:hypothetical protein